MQNEQILQPLLRDLLQFLAVHGPCSAKRAMEGLGFTQSRFSRLVASTDQVLKLGRARATRYAALRAVSGVHIPVPLYEVPVGSEKPVRKMAELFPIRPRGFYVESAVDELESDLFDDLPYFLNDLRPEGFLGRLIPARHPELALPPDVRNWSADHCLQYLTRYGWNLPGAFVLGEQAFASYLAKTADPPDLVTVAERELVYARLAREVLMAGEPGSSAGGEQAKFLAVRGPETPVLVKFSPPIKDALSARQADLLACEHIAHRVLAAHGLPAARSTLLRWHDQVFLEVERFDRLGLAGRRGTISLLALDAEFTGLFKLWSVTLAELAQQKIISEEDRLIGHLFEVFGSLIANTDMHPGNLTFITEGARVTGLAPVYDMLPMLYAPDHASLPERVFQPPVPKPSDAAVFASAHRAATDFWAQVAESGHVSEDFRAIARDNERKVVAIEELGRRLPQA
jgi:hypothetical protein